MGHNEKLLFRKPVYRHLKNHQHNQNQPVHGFHFNRHFSWHPTKHMHDEMHRNQQGAMSCCQPLLPPSEGVLTRQAPQTSVPGLQSLMAALIRRIKVTLRLFACNHRTIIWWWHTNVMMATAISRRRGDGGTGDNSAADKSDTAVDE